MGPEVGVGDIKPFKPETVRCLVSGERGMDFSLTNCAAVERSCVLSEMFYG